MWADRRRARNQDFPQVAFNMIFLRVTHAAQGEHGGVAGIVTLEDVMEEVIGDIRDEFDEEIEVDYEQLDKYNYIFEGKTLINDMSRVIGIKVNTFDLIRGDADSLAGMMLELLGRIPKKNSEIRYKEFRFKIIAVNKRRIEKINR